MVMETPAVIKMNTFKYNTSSSAAIQPPIYFHNTNTTTSSSTSTIMGTPQLQYHNNKSVFSNTNAQAIYLKPPSDNLESKSSSGPQGATIDDSEISIFDAQKYFNDTNVTKTRSQVSTTVLSTTDDHDDRAMIGDNKNSNVSNPSRLSCGSSSSYNRVRSFHATPTASSEASWNSQTGLLSHPAGGLAVSLRSLPNSTLSSNQERLSGGFTGTSTGKWFFRRKCPCSGKKSVQVKEPGTNSYIKPRPVTDHVQQQHQQERVSISSTPKNLISSSRHDQFPSNTFHKQQQSRLSGSGRPVNDGPGGGFSFPILNNMSLPTQKNLEEPPRESLEVFQPVDESPAIRKSNGGGRGFGFPGSPISRVVALDDDMASDASSDLFEIESFSTQTTSYPIYRRRDSLDEAQNFNTRRFSLGTNNNNNNNNNNNTYGRRSVDEPMTPSVAPTECYEPSEASIDWSVTTAEGFDRSSVTNFSISASEFEEVTMSRMHNGGGGKYNNNKKGSGSGGLLMSCRQEKAVSVGPQPVRCVTGEGQHGGMVPLMSTFMHVGGRVLHTNNISTSSSSKNKQPPLARSHSARLSLAFAA